MPVCTARKEGIYAAFSVFDGFMPLAVAGIPVDKVGVDLYYNNSFEVYDTV